MADTKISAASRLTGTGKVKRPVALAGSTTAFSLQDNYEATSAPATTDDNTQGYSIGSLWQRKDTGEIWRCIDVTTNAAVWVLTALASLLHPGFVAGRWYPLFRGSQVAGSAMANANRIYFTPYILPRAMTVSDLGVRITTGSAGNCQLAVYAADPTTKLPTGNALASTGSIVTTATGVLSADITGADVALPAGLIWTAVNVDNTAVAFAAMNGNDHGALTGSATLANVSSGVSGVNYMRYFAQTFGTWPDMTSNPTTELTDNRGAVLFAKAA